jgi:hypothetical protein
MYYYILVVSLMSSKSGSKRNPPKRVLGGLDNKVFPTSAMPKRQQQITRR